MSNIYELAPVDSLQLEIDPLATLTMTYTAEGLQELRNDIAANGQKEPIKLRDGKILDGRHRHKVCKDLNIGIVCEDVGSISDKEALTIVVTNSISKTTTTDAAKTEAYLLCKAKGVLKSDMPKTFSRLDSNCVSKLAFIEKMNPEYLTILLHQNKVRLYNAEFEKVEDYGTIHGIWRTLKGNQKYENQVVEVIPEPVSARNYQLNLEEYFDDAAAESEYWDLFNVAKDAGSNLHPDTELGKRIAGLIKHKYSR